MYINYFNPLIYSNMPIKLFSSLILLIAICFVVAQVAMTKGGFSHLLDTFLILTILMKSAPYLVLWAVANTAKGITLPKFAMGLSVLFIAIDFANYQKFFVHMNENTQTVVLAMILCMQILLPLITIVGVIVTRSR